MIAKIEQDRFYGSLTDSDAGTSGAPFPLQNDTPATDTSDYVSIEVHRYI